MSFEEFWNTHKAWLRSYVKRHCYQSADADDVMQCIALKAMRAYPRCTHFEDIRDRGWLIRIAQYALMDYYKRHAKSPQYFGDMEILDQIATPDSMPTIESIVIRDFINSLDEPWQSAMILHLYYGASIKELSIAMGKPYWTVAKRISRLRKSLAKILGDDT